jgi:epoxyqueuosine reductase
LKGARLRELAKQAGFDLCGFAVPSPIEPRVLLEWLEAGFDADMDWMRDRIDKRLDVKALLPEARTVIALACNYWRDDAEGPIARYARGRDYHATLKDRVRTLRRLLLEEAPGIETYASVDTGPVMEKVWAVRAGLGYVGKNGCLITESFGSWVLLSVLIIDAEVDGYAVAPMPDRCGRCRQCIDACPTDAILPNAQVDAGRCLSYWTIENEGAIPTPIAETMEDIVFGCDICQTVCPLNNFPVVAQERFAPREVGRLTTLELAALSKEDYQRLIPGTPLARAKYDGLRRNAAYALGAAQDSSACELLERLATDESERVREAAQWALKKLAS